MDSSHVARIAGAVRLAVIAGAAWAWVAPPPAAANEFVINACQADRAEFSTRAFEDFANRGMMWKRACDPEGPGLRGLVTANVVRDGRVERGARSLFILRAPEGTQFARFTWSGQARRRDCRYALQLWAARPDRVTRTIKNVRANTGCPARGRMQAAGWPRAQTYDVGGATSIVQRVICVGSRKTPYCSARTLNYIRTFKAAATVVDVSAPGVTITQDTAFTRGEWVRGTQQVNYAALDNVGVRVARAMVDGRNAGEDTRVCNYAQRIPCTNGAGGIVVDTSRLPEGSHPFVVQAEDAAGNAAVSSALTGRVDNSAPGSVPVVVQGGEGWRNQNNFDLSWTSPAEVDRAPIVATHVKLCPANGGACLASVHPTAGTEQISDLAIPGQGEWELRLWREDAASNQEPANASVPVTLRYDAEPPQLGFEESPASDPTSVTVLVTDALSGLAGGQIEISREGSGVWEALATQQDGRRLTARIDDARFAPGSYALRATAFDRATNLGSTDRRSDGRPMTVNLPLRTPTLVRGGVLTTRTVPRGHPRRRHRQRSRRVTVLQPKARVGVGRVITLAGEVMTRGGQAIRGAELQVLASTAGSPEQVVATLRTDDLGRYRYETHAQTSSVVRLIYPGTATTLPAQRAVTITVPAASTIRARPRSAVNGQTVVFAGKLRSLPVPPGGKLVELQVVLSGEWQTFRTLRTTPEGRWHLGYRFRRSCGVLQYRFRLRIPAESAYPFETGHTHGISVRVRGRPCG